MRLTLTLITGITEIKFPNQLAQIKTKCAVIPHASDAMRRFVEALSPPITPELEEYLHKYFLYMDN